MKNFSIVNSANPPPVPKLHLFWVCEPNKAETAIRAWGKTKQEAGEKLKNIYPDASITWKKEL